MATNRTSLPARPDPDAPGPAGRGPHDERARAVRRPQQAAGERTRRRLLEAARTAASGPGGFQSLRVDDIAQAAGTSHGTFYLYFSGREDLLDALIHDALTSMDTVVSAFPDVCADQDGRDGLLTWVREFCAVYARHAVALRLLSSVDGGDQSLRRAGLRLLWRLADAIARGMTGSGEPVPPGQHPEFTALSCAMMLERICYLLSVGATMPPGDALERVTAIFVAAFHGQDRGRDPGQGHGLLAGGPEASRRRM